MMLGQQNWLFCIILFIHAASPVIVQHIAIPSACLRVACVGQGERESVSHLDKLVQCSEPSHQSSGMQKREEL